MYSWGMLKLQPSKIELYTTEGGDCPYAEWHKGLPVVARDKLAARLARAEQGFFGDHRHLDGSVWELRDHSGPGYRVYFSVQCDRILVILAGSTKRDQKRAVKRAKEMLEDWVERKK